MAKSDGTVVIDTLLDVDGINDGSKKINKKLDSVADKSESVGSKLKSALGTGLKTAVKIGVTALTAMSTTVVGLGKIGLEYNSQIEDYTVNFTTMLGDAEKGAAKIQELKKLAASTPFALSDLAESTQTLLAFNVASDESTDILSMLGDISLGNADKLSRLSTAYGKVNSTGKLTGETLQQMIEAGFNPALVITQETGETMEEFNKRVSDGGVSVDELRKAMVKATSKGGQFNNGMKNASKTMSGLISTLKDNAISLVGDVFKPISDSLTNDLLPKVIDSVGELQRAFNTGGVNGLVEAAGNMLGDYIAEFSTLLPKIGDLASGLVTSLIDGIKNNAGRIAAGAAELVETLVSFIFDAAPDLVDVGFELAISLVNGLSQKLPDLLESALSGIGETIGNIFKNLPGLLEAGGNIIAGLLEGIALGFESLGNAIFGIEEECEEVVIATSELSDEILNMVDPAVEAASAYSDLKTSIAESVSAELSQIDYVQKLYSELQTLADENGRVREGYESRVSFILNELNSALGTEYTMNGNLINQYAEMKGSIEEIILAKKAQILLEAQEEAYKTAIQNTTEAQKAQAAQLLVVNEAQKKYNDAVAAYNDELFKLSPSALKHAMEVQYLSSLLQEEQAEYDALSGSLFQYYSDVEKYETASALIIEGKTEEAVACLTNMSEGFISASDAAGKSAEEHKKILEDQVVMTEINAQLMEQAYKDGVEGVSEEMVKTARQTAEQAKEEFFKVGGNITKSMAEGGESAKYTLNKEMQSLVNGAINVGKTQAGKGTSIGSALASGIKRGITDQMPTLLAAARNVADRLTSTIKARLQIHSPSRVFRDEIGAMMAKGLGLGFEMQMPDELRAMQKAIDLGAITQPLMASGMIVPPRSAYSTESKNGTLSAIESLLSQFAAAAQQSGGSNSFRITAQINRRTLFDEMIDEGRARQGATGVNPFELA